VVSCGIVWYRVVSKNIHIASIIITKYCKLFKNVKETIIYSSLSGTRAPLIYKYSKASYEKISKIIENVKNGNFHKGRLPGVLVSYELPIRFMNKLDDFTSF
jgi:protein-arginine kinase activator protein McsA